jgi:hypothetical protein
MTSDDELEGAGDAPANLTNVNLGEVPAAVDFSTPDSTPPGSPTSGSTSQHCYIQDGKGGTPDSIERLRNAGYQYGFRVMQGIPSWPGEGNRASWISGLFPIDHNFNDGIDDDDIFCCNGQVYKDSSDNDLISLRVVIDINNQVTLARNGRGSLSIPFHHQMSLVAPVHSTDGTYQCDYDVVRARGREVNFAGEIGVSLETGKIFAVSNKSGHYLTSPDKISCIINFILSNPHLAGEEIQTVCLPRSYVSDTECTFASIVVADEAASLDDAIKDSYNQDHQGRLVSVTSETPNPPQETVSCAPLSFFSEGCGSDSDEGPSRKVAKLS